MKRLTYWNGKKYCLPQGKWREIADRLAAYENTGLEPEEIAAVLDNKKDRTMLDILKGRLPAGLEIARTKEKPSKYLIWFSCEGLETYGELVKSCAPGANESVVDAVICNAMANIAIQKNDTQTAKMWLDKLLHR